MTDTPDGNSMWGGRFGGGPAAIMQEINASIPVDKRLWQEDIVASRAHAAMLGAQGIIGEVAGRLHTARSRNDQVAADFRLWVRAACERIDAGLAAIERS